jgi:hypothetical protein
MKKKKEIYVLGAFVAGAITACILTANYFKKTFDFSNGLISELDDAFASME